MNAPPPACPEVDRLESFVRGHSGDREREEVDTHLNTCPRCRDQLLKITNNIEIEERIRSARLHLADSHEEPHSGISRGYGRHGANQHLSSPTSRGVSQPQPDEPERDTGTGIPLTHPESIGGFRLIEEIGRGGMGIVYLAEQTNPKRRVALKVVRPGLSVAELAGRFAQEVQVLGNLKHPGIAAIHAAGVETVTGPRGIVDKIPYLVMEYVEGERIDRFCEMRALSDAARAELLARVCDALDHAHAHGVVHRDLKPSNVLVEPALDDDPLGPGGRPRVLDFGVARILGEESSRTELTQVGEIVGTLPFMSPEQIDGTPDPVDTRVDIYALGVLGWLLLSGDLPFDPRGRSTAEFTRTVLDADPGRLRSRDSRRRADLDVILHQAMEKDRSRRYTTAAAFAADLRRVVRHEPIEARPPSRLYYFRKFARRNPALVTSVGLLLLVLVGSAVVAGALAFRAQRAEELASERLRSVEKEAAKLEAVNDFLRGMLTAADPHRGGDQERTVRDLLDRAAQELVSGGLADHPEVESEVRGAIGNSYWSLGRYREAESHFRRAMLLQEASDPRGLPLFRTLNDLGILLSAGMNRFDSADSCFQRSLQIASGWDLAVAESRAAYAFALGNYGGYLADRSRFAEAESILTQSLELTDSAPSQSRLAKQYNLAVIVHLRGNHEAAAVMYGDVLASMRSMAGPESPNLTKILVKLASAEQAAGRLSEAEAHCREALELNRRIFGPDHPDVASSLGTLGSIRIDQGHLDEGIEMLTSSLEQAERLLGNENRITLRIRRMLARAWQMDGRFETAQAALESSFEIAHRVLGPEDPEVVTHLRELGSLSRRSGDVRRAEDLWRRAHESTVSTLGEKSGPARALADSLRSLQSAG